MFGFSLLNGWGVLLGGSALIAAPIIIHLLSKRRFKIVDWAAIDFLLEADRRNRRRIRLENLILLLLRCLAVLLIALLVARPLLTSSGLVAAAIKANRVERVVLLDDSPSMGVTQDGKTAFAAGVDAVTNLLDELGRQRSGDAFTLLLTSQPDRPINTPGEALSAPRIEELKTTLKALAPSDLSAQLDKALLAVGQRIADRKTAPSKMLYLVTDFRQHDWAAAPGQPEDQTVAGTLRRLAGQSGGVFLVDVGQNVPANLTVANIAATDKALVAGVESRFEVKVANHGATDVDDVEVNFAAGEGVAQTARISHIAAGAVGSAPFTVRFRDSGSLPLRAEVGPDALPADNSRFYAARVRPGVDVLLIDGDPSAEFGQSGTFFLNLALAPHGQTVSGFAPTVITEDALDATALDKWQAIFVCNVNQLPPDTVTALEQWTARGGGLVFFLGNDVDPEAYNDRFYRNGKGLLPARLRERGGDPDLKEAVRFWAREPNHPITAIFEGENNVFAQMVKVYRWWNVELPKDADASVKVLARYTNSGSDSDAAPAIVEKSFGQGKVVLFTTTANNAWNNWPKDPSFLFAIQETARQVCRPAGDEGGLAVGMPLRYELDSSRFQPEALISGPKQEPTSVRAVLQAGARPGDRKLVIEYPSAGDAGQTEETGKAGFYKLALKPLSSGRNEDVLFAANIDPGEGDMKRVEWAEIKTHVGEKVQYMKGRVSLSGSALGTGVELWRTVLLILVGVLCVEQLLAWSFGRRRT